ncbi:gamma-glutamyltransferase family protein [Celerinatantimonas sp. YJH-8]|uniref:gamma-glutamyltransferase family protein n=1 Tax=Celerinatantimonas sp. YJH-8 TaxID=3228714 RepID=UPI0038C0E62E
MTDCAFTAPHATASEIGLSVLKQGGTAIEAMVAAAASISVLYPHMSGLGGDGFWLIHEPGKKPVAINASGRSAGQATLEWFQHQGFSAIPSRGPLACVDSAGVVEGWQKALQYSSNWQAPIDLQTLLTPAAQLAKDGITVTQSLQNASELTASALHEQPGFAEYFLPDGTTLKTGQRLYNPALSDLFLHLAKVGLDDFYRGQTAQVIADGFKRADALLNTDDLAGYHAEWVEPLSVQTSQGTFYNLPLPTQGIASLLIAAIMDEQFQGRSIAKMSEAEQLHCIIEATKQAFMIRDRLVCDPRYNDEAIDPYLSASMIHQLSSRIDPRQALAWPQLAHKGDTVWMGCCDSEGRMVSYIQSLYWEFGSGVVLPELGVIWNNRGVSFSLEPGAKNQLRPNCQPFHTLNPAFASLNDGRNMVYGTMGGEGQPQTQAAILWRYLYQQQPLDKAIAAPRWLLGRTWGESAHDLKLEQDIADTTCQQLQSLGHVIRHVPACNELMGHAGAIVLKQQKILAAASDPRSDGKACVFSDFI